MKAAVLFVLATAAFGQAPAIRFEVASVKPVLTWPPAGGGTGERGAAGTGGGCPTTMKVDRERADFKCANLAMLIGYAYRISPDRVTGPEWMSAVGATRFNIVAKIPQGTLENQVPEMLQSLLADRFRLIVHRGPANLPIYALVVAKGGLKVKAAASQTGALVARAESDAVPTRDSFYGSVQSRTAPNPDGGPVTSILSNPRMGTVLESGDPGGVQRWEADSISFAGLADLIDHVAPLSLPVMDMTGLKGRYRLALEVSLRDLRTPHQVSDTGAMVLNGFNDGLQKLGLRLESRKGPVETIIVDRVEKIPTED